MPVGHFEQKSIFPNQKIDFLNQCVQHLKENINNKKSELSEALGWNSLV